MTEEAADSRVKPHWVGWCHMTYLLGHMILSSPFKLVYVASPMYSPPRGGWPGWPGLSSSWSHVVRRGGRQGRGRHTHVGNLSPLGVWPRYTYLGFERWWWQIGNYIGWKTFCIKLRARRKIRQSTEVRRLTLLILTSAKIMIRELAD